MINTCRKHDFNGETVLVMHTADECPVCALLSDLNDTIIGAKEDLHHEATQTERYGLGVSWDRVEEELEALDVYRAKPAPVTGGGS